MSKDGINLAPQQLADQSHVAATTEIPTLGGGEAFLKDEEAEVSDHHISSFLLPQGQIRICRTCQTRFTTDQLEFKFKMTASHIILALLQALCLSTSAFSDKYRHFSIRNS
jgi:hypothetical protein